MPKFDINQNIAAEHMTFGQQLEATKQETAALKAKRDILEARKATAPVGARGAMQAGIDALNAKIAQNEALLAHVEKPTTDEDKPAEVVSLGAHLDRISAARQRSAVIVKPEVLAAGLKAQAAEDMANLQAEHDAKPAAEKLFMGDLADLEALDKKKAA